MDRPTDRPMDGRTDKAGCRVTLHATKKSLFGLSVDQSVQLYVGPPRIFKADAITAKDASSCLIRLVYIHLS